MFFPLQVGTDGNAQIFGMFNFLKNFPAQAVEAVFRLVPADMDDVLFLGVKPHASSRGPLLE